VFCYKRAQSSKTGTKVAASRIANTYLELKFIESLTIVSTT